MHNDCELISAEDNDYLLWRANLIAEKSLSKGGYIDEKDEPRRISERNLTFQYQRWENVLRQIFAMYFSEYPLRILKYINENREIKYKEIDFVRKNENTYFFCEFKFKDHCDITNIKSSVFKRGFYQLKSSHSIAKARYEVKDVCLIIVDMSFILGIPYLDGEQKPVYMKLVDIAHSECFCDVVYGDSQSRQLKDVAVFANEKDYVIFIDSQDFIGIAESNGLLKSSEVIEFLEAHKARNPQEGRRSISFSTGAVTSEMSPFLKLRELINGPNSSHD
jgi:hypothetical protein